MEEGVTGGGKEEGQNRGLQKGDGRRKRKRNKGKGKGRGEETGLRTEKRAHICISIYTYIYIFIKNIDIFKHSYKYIYKYIYVNTYIHTNMYIYIHILIHIFVYKPVEEGENITGRSRIGTTLETRTKLPTAHEHVDVVGSHERLGHVDDCHCERPAHNDY